MFSPFFLFSGQGITQSTSIETSWFTTTLNLNSNFQETSNGFHHNAFKCQICFKECRHKSDLALHMKTHAGPLIPCPICSTFTRLFALKSHLKNVHSLLYCSGCFGTFGLNDSSSHRCPSQNFERP